MNSFVRMRYFKPTVIFLFIILCSWNTADAQFGIYSRPNVISLFRNNAPTEYESRRVAYFENGFFETLTYQIDNDSNVHSQYVFDGKLSPRLIDQNYFDNLSRDEPTSDEQFFCDGAWQYKWIQVRFFIEEWPGFKDIRTGAFSFKDQTQYGGYLICAQESGIFVSQGRGIDYIPYTYIRNIRRGTSFGQVLDNLFRPSRRGLLGNYRYTENDLIYGVFAIPVAALVYNIAGISPNKVIRMGGEPRGKEFASRVKRQVAYGNSSNAASDYPLTLMHIKKNRFNIIPRNIFPMDNFDSLELIADKIQLRVIPHYLDIPSIIVNSQNAPRPLNPALSINGNANAPKNNGQAIDPSIPSMAIPTGESTGPGNASNTPPITNLNTFNNSNGEIPILWAIENFEPRRVSQNLFKTYPKIQKQILSKSQLEQLTKPSDIQMLSVLLLTGNGIDFSRLIQFTEEQTAKLNRTVTMDAVYAEMGSTLKVMDIPSVEYRNLTLLYEKLNALRN